MIVPEPSSYCAHAVGHPFHGPYHDLEYGFPVRDDHVLFERLCLEINQAGLSWLTILKKRDGFRDAYAGFDPDAVAAFGEADRARLLTDARIVRNRLKVDATIHNARRILSLQETHGSFADWLDAHQMVVMEPEPSGDGRGSSGHGARGSGQASGDGRGSAGHGAPGPGAASGDGATSGDVARPRRKAEWVGLFKKTFRFTGGEITGEFLMSTGYLPGAHDPACPVFEEIARLDPPWMRAGLGS